MKLGMQAFGGKELEAALAKLSDRASKKLMRESMAWGLEPMKRRAEQLAPKGPGGGMHLEDQILIKTARVPGGAPAVAMGPSKGTFYGGFLEFGTVHLAARPFMRPAWDGTLPIVLDRIGKACWVELAAKGVHRTATSTAPVQSPGRTI